MMLRILIIFILSNTFFNVLYAQDDCYYDKLISEAENYSKSNEFEKALLKFQAAQVAARKCRLISTKADSGILNVLSEIKKQKEAALNALKTEKELLSLKNLSREQEQEIFEAYYAISYHDTIITKVDTSLKKRINS